MAVTSASDQSPIRSRRPGRRVLVILGAIVVAAVLAGGFGLWFVLVGFSGPAAVNAADPVFPAGNVAAPTSLDGTWNVDTTLGSTTDDSESFAGYRVQEQLVGIGGHTAVGRTTKVTGTMTLKGAVVQAVNVTADLTNLTSDQGARDDQLRGQAIQTDTFPTTTFKLTTPIDLKTLPDEGKAVSATATGSMTLHGVTKTVSIAVQAERKGGIIAVTGTLPIVFSEWSIEKPNSFSVLSVDDHGTMELHLLFTHA